MSNYPPGVTQESFDRAHLDLDECQEIETEDVRPGYLLSLYEFGPDDLYWRVEGNPQDWRCRLEARWCHDDSLHAGADVLTCELPADLRGQLPDTDYRDRESDR